MAISKRFLYFKKLKDARERWRKGTTIVEAFALMHGWVYTSETNAKNKKLMYHKLGGKG